MESEPVSTRSRTLLTLASAGILASILSLAVLRDVTGSRVRFFTTPQGVALPFAANDDYRSIVNRIGRPSWDRTAPGPEGIPAELHLLGYPGRGYTLVLYGSNIDFAKYVGAVNRGGRTVHTVKLSDGTDSAKLLAGLRKR